MGIGIGIGIAVGTGIWRPRREAAIIILFQDPEESAVLRQDWRMAWRGEGASLWRRFLSAALALVIAAAIWLPSLHFICAPRLDDYWTPDGLPPKARALAARHVELWTRPELREREIRKMRARNPEWDFMGRTFLVLALANASLRDPATRAANLAVVDRILEETLKLEREEGFRFFLMEYGRTGDFVAKPERSVFVDGEIALMLGARRLVEERADYKPLLAARVAAISASLRNGPVRCGESYPNECWMFCNAAALAALRMSAVLDGADYSDLFREWVATAKAHLLHADTGLLISCFTYDGRPLDGPEGSTVWMAAHCLQVVDEEFARDQYARARRELGRALWGFSYAREWPLSWRGAQDVDSGPEIPLLGASASSSGLALLAAASFEDREFLAGLLASLNLGGFPIEREGRLRFCASNQVGDAVLLYALVQGPLWRKLKEPRPK